ncbi:hypothetical protein H9P43_005853 [Blastocladiella emersonii ATCC 22665]|nr:hypothetical protein H9P43_005853 [Blastocladiella emersonii ATCC 22665]
MDVDGDATAASASASPDARPSTSSTSPPGTFVPQRDMISCWLNTFCTLWREVIHSNVDLRILKAFGTSLVAFYATKYSTKAREVIENHAAIVAAFKARLERFDAQDDAFSRGHKKLLSLAYHMSGNTMEIPETETMTALFLHTAAAGIFSHKFAPLLLYQAMRWLDLAGVAAGEVTEQDVECIASTISVDGKPMLNVALHDYVFRPPELENLSWYEFISSWSRVNMPPKMREVLVNGGRVVPAQAELGPAADMPPGTRLSFMADHPLAKTHELRKNIVEVVPKIAGPHMPDPRKFGDVPGDILDENGSAIAKFKAFKEGLQPGDPALNHLEYAQEYYFSLDGARAYRECRDRENAELWAGLSQEERGELFVPSRDGDRNASSSRAKASANEDPTAE